MKIKENKMKLKIWEQGLRIEPMESNSFRLGYKIWPYMVFSKVRKKKRKERKLKTIYFTMSNCATFGGYYAYIHEILRLTLTNANLGCLLES